MSAVMDASAILALLNGETGAETVAARLPGARISSVNVVEVGTKLIDGGMTVDAARKAIDLLQMEIIDFDLGLSVATYGLRASTRSAGLSLGDRACLALAIRDKLPAITADRNWAALDLGCAVELIR